MIFHRVSTEQRAIVNAHEFASVLEAHRDDEQCQCHPGGTGAHGSFWTPCDCEPRCVPKSYYPAGEMPRALVAGSASVYTASERRLVGDWSGAVRVVLVGEQNPYGGHPRNAML